MEPKGNASANQTNKLWNVVRNFVAMMVLFWFLVSGIKGSCDPDKIGECVSSAALAVLIAFGAGRFLGQEKGYSEGREAGRVESVTSFIERTPDKP